MRTSAPRVRKNQSAAPTIDQRAMVLKVRLNTRGGGYFLAMAAGPARAGCEEPPSPVRDIIADRFYVDTASSIADKAIIALLSLAAMIPIVFSLSRGEPSALPFDGAQREEILLTIVQSVVADLSAKRRYRLVTQHLLWRKVWTFLNCWRDSLMD